MTSSTPATSSSSKPSLTICSQLHSSEHRPNYPRLIHLERLAAESAIEAEKKAIDAYTQGESWRLGISISLILMCPPLVFFVITTLIQRGIRILWLIKIGCVASKNGVFTL